MTIQEMHRTFRFLYDKMDGLNYPNVLPEEIDLLLNKSQENIIKQRYGSNNLKKESFEQTEKRTQDIKKLIRQLNYIPDPSYEFNTYYNTYNIDTQYQTDIWFIIWEKAYITCTSCNKEVYRPVATYGLGPSNQVINGLEVEVRPTTHLELEKNRRNAFKGPDHTKVLRVTFNDKIEIIPADDCTLLYYIMRYIKKPVKMSLANNVSCELSDEIHQEIVDQAVQIALEGIEAKRNNTFTPIVKNNNE